MIKVIKEKSTFSFVKERDWFIGDLKMKENVIKEENEVHYNNGLITSHIYKYYIRVNKKGKICSGQISQDGVIRELSIENCIKIMNAVDWNY